jgi:hypothetical protein
MRLCHTANRRKGRTLVGVVIMATAVAVLVASGVFSVGSSTETSPVAKPLTAREKVEAHLDALDQECLQIADKHLQRIRTFIRERGDLER